MKMQPTESNIATICRRLADSEITLPEAARETGWSVDRAGHLPVLVPQPDLIHVDDGHCEIVYPGFSARESAQQYVDAGNWEVGNQTIWITVHTWFSGLDAHGQILRARHQHHTVAVDPAEPPCPAGKHDWQSPHDLLGGVAENPGVSLHGGGVIILSVCMYCGCERTVDTWAQAPETGEQGLTSIKFEPGKYAAQVQTRYPKR